MSKSHAPARKTHQSRQHKSQHQSKSAAMTKPTRAVIYVRVSVDRDDQTSTSTQARECQTYCQERGLEMVEVFEDLGRSAFSGAARPELERALAMIEGKHADLLLVWKMDRFTRNVRDFHKLLSRIQDSGAHFASVKEPMLATDSTENPMGATLATLFATLAEMESRNIRTRIQPWHDQRREDGAIACGPAPFGYTKKDAKGKTTRNQLHVIPAQAKVIQDMAERVLAGQSMSSVAKLHGMAHQSARRTLVNPTIGGMRDLGNGQLQESSQWDAILDAETFLALRDLLLDPSRDHGQSRAPKWLLSSIMLCGADDCTGSIQTNGSAQGMRYQCSECGQSYYATKADDMVRDYLLEKLDDSTWIEMQARGRTSDITQLSHLSSVLDTYREEFEAGEMSADIYKSKKATLAARMAELETADALALPTVASVRDAWPSMDVKGKRLVIAAAFKAITLMPYQAGRTGTKRIIIDISESMAA